MTKESNAMQVQEQEFVQSNGNERMRARATFVPQADIYETEEDVVVTLDMPGANRDSIDVTLEKNILTINANSPHSAPDGYELGFAEFQSGDYERSFRLTDQINQEDKGNEDDQGGEDTLVIKAAQLLGEQTSQPASADQTDDHCGPDDLLPTVKEKAQKPGQSGREHAIDKDLPTPSALCFERAQGAMVQVLGRLSHKTAQHPQRV